METLEELGDEIGSKRFGTDSQQLDRRGPAADGLATYERAFDGEGPW